MRDGLSDAEDKLLKKKVGKHLAKVRSSLDEKSLVKLTWKLNKAVAEVRDERRSSSTGFFSPEQEKRRIDSQRGDLLSNPLRCKQIKQNAIDEGWNGEKVIVKLVDYERVRNDSICEEVAQRYNVSVVLVREILNNESHFANAITEYNILNRGW